MSSCRELDNNRSALSAASAFAIATAGANEGTPTKEKYRRMSLASTGSHTYPVSNNGYIKASLALFCNWAAKLCKLCLVFSCFGLLFAYRFIFIFCRFSNRSEKWRQRVCDQTSSDQQSPECAEALGVQTLSGKHEFTADNV